MDLITRLRQSLDDDFLSKTEKNALKTVLDDQSLDNDTLNFLRTKIYDLANEKVTAANYQFVMQWVKDASNLLQAHSAEQTRVYFSPGDECRNAIISQMNLALRQLKICVFTISDDLITRAIIDAHRRGLAIRIITDNDKSFDRGSDIDQLARERISIKMDVSDNHMHHKFMLADDRYLLTGSYNWTSSAARFNHENILITKESAVVKSFLKEFDSLWKQMAEY
jgi:mitochondrial cardiolipin hydrolase